VRTDVVIGMTFEEAQDALRRAGVAFETGLWSSSSYGSFSKIEYTEGGFRYAIEFDDWDRVYRIFGLGGDLPDLAAGQARVQEVARVRGAPTLLRVVTTTNGRGESFDWVWDGRGDSLTVSLSRRDGEAWQARLHGDGYQAFAPDRLSLADARVRADEIRGRLGRTVQVGGDRGAAVARWTELVAWRLSVVDRFLEVAAKSAPGAPISTVTFVELAAHSAWLEHNDRLFSEPDDWRGALVVLSSRDHRDEIEGSHLGWHVDGAIEGERAVRIVAGPFATGVYRVLIGAEEIYPVRGDLPLDQVTFSTTIEPQHEHSRKMPTHVVRASLGSVVAELTGYNIERVARYLVAARASATDRAGG
jgi:hypothetical protein